MARFPSPAPLARRFVSWLWDYLVILVWLAVVFVFVGLPQIFGWIDLSPVWTDQTWSDVGLTLLTVLPFFLYLYLTEISGRRATWGKRRAGLVVADDEDRSEPDRGSVAVRNLLKVLPWQLGHMGTMRLVTAEEVTTVALTFQAASLSLLALIVVPIILRRRGIHDVLAGTTVVAGGSPSPGIP